MTAQLSREFIEANGGQKALDDAIATFKKALKDHSKTVDVPAPTTNSVIERIVKQFDGEYEIIEPPAPEQAPEVEMYPEVSLPEPEPVKLTLEETKEHKLNELIRYRRNMVGAGVTYEGYIFWSDAMSQNALMLARLTADDGFAVKWKAADGQYPILERDDIDKLLNLMRSHTQDCFNREERLSKKINAMRNVRHINEFDIRAEWEKA